jgi:hypothetical protein
MSRPRVASVEAKLEIITLKAQIAELEKFRERIELGQKWLLCAVYTLGGLIGGVYTVIEIIKTLNIRFGN